MADRECAGISDAAELAGRIQCGATVRTDEHAATQDFPNHSAVKYGIGQDSAGDADANTIEGVSGLLKRGYGGTCDYVSFTPHFPYQLHRECRNR